MIRLGVSGLGLLMLRKHVSIQSTIPCSHPSTRRSVCAGAEFGQNSGPHSALPDLKFNGVGSGALLRMHLEPKH